MASSAGNQTAIIKTITKKDGTSDQQTMQRMDRGEMKMRDGAEKRGPTSPSIFAIPTDPRKWRISKTTDEADDDSEMHASDKLAVWPSLSVASQSGIRSFLEGIPEGDLFGREVKRRKGGVPTGSEIGDDGSSSSSRVWKSLGRDF